MTTSAADAWVNLSASHPPESATPTLSCRPVHTCGLPLLQCNQYPDFDLEKNTEPSFAPKDGLLRRITLTSLQPLLIDIPLRVRQSGQTFLGCLRGLIQKQDWLRTFLWLRLYWILISNGS